MVHLTAGLRLLVPTILDLRWFDQGHLYRALELFVGRFKIVLFQRDRGLVFTDSRQLI